MKTANKAVCTGEVAAFVKLPACACQYAVGILAGMAPVKHARPRVYTLRRRRHSAPPMSPCTSCLYDGVPGMVIQPNRRVYGGRTAYALVICPRLIRAAVDKAEDAR